MGQLGSEGAKVRFYAILDPRQERSYKITPVCVYVCMSVCMYVTKINFVNLLKIGSYDFF